MKKKILVHGPLWTNEGISKSHREYVRQFIQNGNQVWITQTMNNYAIQFFGSDFLEGYKSFNTLEEEHITFLYGYTQNWNINGKDHSKIVGYSVYEGDVLPLEWVKNMNLPNVAEVWVPSQYVKAVYKANGVRTPIRVVPHGVLPYYKPKTVSRSETFEKIYGDPIIKESDTFIFFGMGGIYGLSQRDRKGVDVLLKAFKEEFFSDEKVCLILKLNISYAINSHLEKGDNFNVETYLKQFLSGKENFYLIMGDLIEDKLVSLYNAVDCGVFPSRAEGFGMCEMEMMACGKPVITTGFGGTIDFSTPELRIGFNGLKLAEFDSKQMQRWPYIGSRWAEPSVESLRKKMREVFENREKFKRIGLEEGKRIRKNYKWKVIGKRNENFLDKIMGDKCEMSVKSIK